MVESPEMNTLRAQAQGKLLLIGEHAAVYGHPALGIPLSCSCSIEWKVQEQTRSIKPKALESVIYNGTLLAQTSKEYDLFVKILHQGWQALHLPDTPSGSFVIQNSIPESGGFGSSGALSACLAQVLLHYSGSFKDQAPIFTATSDSDKSHQAFYRTWQLANYLERTFHGSPSGIDTGLSLSHGPCGFNFRPQKQDEPSWEPWPDPQNILPNLTTFPKVSLPLVYGAIARQGSTKELVGAIRSRYLAHDPSTQEQVQTLGRIAHEAIQLIQESSLANLGDLFNQAQDYLRLLGVSTSALEEIFSLAREVGFCGAKLSGAGGGGAFLLLAPGADQVAELSVSLEKLLKAKGINLLVPLTLV